MKRICKYLIDTKNRGIIYQPDISKGIEVYVDADFARSWNKVDNDNAENVLSRTGYIIYYAGCPVIWASKLQTEFALSTAEAEYIALSSAMREAVPLMELIKEIPKTFKTNANKPIVHCNVFEGNESAIAIAKASKFSPRTKHIAIKYHHFRQNVKNGSIEINSIDTKEQIADIFTKPLNEIP